MASKLDSGLSKDDLLTLIEAMHDWEAVGNQEFHAMQLVRSIPMPAEDHEAYEYINNLKEHFKSRERDIKATREVREERAILLKAKLMLIKRDMGIDELFENASAPVVEKKAAPTKEQESELELAKEFIKDLGVQKHYETFLAERRAPAA